MTIEFDILQGSYSWRQCRMGLPTASNMRKILMPKKLQISKPGIKTLAAELIAERALMQSLDIDLASFAERGTILEEDAVPYYEMETDSDIRRIGFAFNPELCIGASPDGLTDSGGLEVKSLSPSKHLSAILTGDCAEYMAQIQTCMWLCDRDRWDLLYYHPSLPSRIITIERDADYLKLLDDAIEALQESMVKMSSALVSSGVSFEAWADHIQALKRGEAPVDPNAVESPLVGSMW